MTWPDVALDPITRLRAVAARYPSAGICETVLDVPFADTWAWVTDFEHSVPRFDSQLTRAKITRRDGDHVKMLVWAKHVPVPLPIDACVEPGFCLMRGRARTYLVVMAAVPTVDGGTRFVHCEAMPWPGLSFLRPIIQRIVEADIRGLRRMVCT